MGGHKWGSLGGRRGSELIGMTVDTPQVQNMVDRMITANLIHRQSHGVYAVADPFVRQVWIQRKAMQLPAQAE